jgi:glc operon protein GlcG
MKRYAVKMLAASLVVAATTAMAQTPPPAYGSPITLAQAKKAMAAAEAEASKNNWPVAIAIVDTGGHLSLFQRQENAQFGSVSVAQEKAWGAVAFRRATKGFQDAIEKGGVNLRLLNLTGNAAVLEGAVPIVVEGKVIGGIGVSGVLSEQDAIVAQAGANALK